MGRNCARLRTISTLRAHCTIRNIRVLTDVLSPKRKDPKAGSAMEGTVEDTRATHLVKALQGVMEKMGKTGCYIDKSLVDSLHLKASALKASPILHQFIMLMAC
ncbi:hypothetical protein CVT26_008417 [Gymnopilus dilepis]|uniref:Uncharacterized protein n=1 Tax=Gymnopilus dilepis TaxID=231916 RepID=A0A409YFV9_9AGAR|nr:hypothetical protein CVT26_008417 [Gymnopilus dilepis]